PSAMGVAFHLTVSRLASRHFWAGAGLRILAHGSTFFCGWSGIAFKVDWYSLSIRFLSAALFGSTGGLSPFKFTPGFWANADPLSAIDKTAKLITKTTTECWHKRIGFMTASPCP
ncbi:MAG: hypothetical protein WA781_18415, partial [Pseudolabrys sp.]